MLAIIVAGNGGKTSRYGSNGTLWCKPCNRKWNVHTPPLWLAASKWNTHRCNEYSSSVHKKMPNTNCNKTVLCFQSTCWGERPRKDWRGIQRLRWKTANKTNKQDTLIKWIVWSTVMCYALFCEFLSIFITNQPTNKKDTLNYGNSFRVTYIAVVPFMCIVDADFYQNCYDRYPECRHQPPRCFR